MSVSRARSDRAIRRPGLPAELASVPPRAFLRHPLASWLSTPMRFTATITRRERARRLSSGRTVVHTRFVVNFRDPVTGRRKQLFFARQKEALAVRDAIVTSVAVGASLRAPHKAEMTVSDVMEHWLQNRRREVKPGTWASYRQAVHYVVGPLLLGTKLERHRYARYGAIVERRACWRCLVVFGSAT